MRFGVAIVFLLVISPAPTLAREGSASNWKFQMDHVVDSTGVGRLIEPSWSIEGDFLAATGRDGCLFVYDHASRHTSKAVLGSVRQFVWLPGNRLVYELLDAPQPVHEGIQGNRVSELHLYDPRTGTDKSLLSIPFLDLKNLQTTVDGRIAFTNEGRNVEWKADVVDTGGVWTSLSQTSLSNLAWDQNGVPWIRKDGATRPIFNDWPGRIWGPIQASPHGDFVAAQVQVEDAVRTVIFTDQGKRFQVLPTGFMASQWSSNDRMLLGFETKDDGHAVTNSKLTLFDVPSKTYTVIPTPDGMIPMDPTWCEATGQVAFVDGYGGLIAIGSLREATE